MKFQEVCAFNLTADVLVFKSTKINVMILMIGLPPVLSASNKVIGC